MNLIQLFVALIAAVRANDYPKAIDLIGQIFQLVAGTPNLPPPSKAKHAALQAGAPDLDFLVNEIESHILTVQNSGGPIPWPQLAPLLIQLLIKLLGLS